MKPYIHFTLSERICLQQLLSEKKSYREIAKILGRSPSTISREVKRNFGQSRNNGKNDGRIKAESKKHRRPV